MNDLIGFTILGFAIFGAADLVNIIGCSFSEKWKERMSARRLASTATQRLWRKAPPRPVFGTPEFEWVTQCPKCGIVAAYGVSKWVTSAWGRSLYGCYRRCHNCGHTWFQK